MTSDTLTNETIKAIEILESEAARRIDEIRQSIDFTCSSLRAQGNMEINRLLESVRKLTMDEYCNKYNADEKFYLEEQSRKRKRTELLAPSKKRDLADAIPHDSTISNKKAPKPKETQITNTPDKISTQSKSQQRKQALLPSLPSLQQQQQLTQSQPQPQTQKQQQKQLQEPLVLQTQHNGPSRKDIINGNQNARKDSSTTSDLEDDEEEVEFGPLFMQFIRPGYPKVTFQLDPQEELNETESFHLQLPYEFVDQFGPGHRRRIADQIQHIENQLETFKQRLLHPPPTARSLSPSSPSPSL